MSNSLFNTLNPNSLGNMLNALKANPMQFLAQRNLKLPQGIGNDPRQIVQYWINNGIMTQDQLANLQNRVNQIRM